MNETDRKRSAPTEAGPARPGAERLIERLRAIARRALRRMYRPEERLFAFRLRRDQNGRLEPEGLSRRYTAIALIGLAGDGGEAVEEVLGPEGFGPPCGRLLAEVGEAENLGDVALALWAAGAAGQGDRARALGRLRELRPAEGAHPTVEIAWALAALSLEPDPAAEELREAVARRLIAAFGAGSPILPHVAGGGGRGLRAHVSSFADVVYPIQALAFYTPFTSERMALDLARLSADHLVSLQGPGGQWWWHYDVRTGDVIERYPVYAVHQHAMGPMALFALADAGAGSRAATAAVRRGLEWLERCPELGGRSPLLDEEAGVVWRKVARREPRKAARYAQALATRLHPSLRVPGLDLALPPTAIDYETRPYEYGWLLYAWAGDRAARLDGHGGVP